MDFVKFSTSFNKWARAAFHAGADIYWIMNHMADNPRSMVQYMETNGKDTMCKLVKKINVVEKQEGQNIGSYIGKAQSSSGVLVHNKTLTNELIEFTSLYYEHQLEKMNQSQKPEVVVLQSEIHKVGEMRERAREKDLRPMTMSEWWSVVRSDSVIRSMKKKTENSIGMVVPEIVNKDDNNHIFLECSGTDPVKVGVQKMKLNNDASNPHLWLAYMQN